MNGTSHRLFKYEPQEQVLKATAPKKRPNISELVSKFEIAGLVILLSLAILVILPLR